MNIHDVVANEYILYLQCKLSVGVYIDTGMKLLCTLTSTTTTTIVVYTLYGYVHCVQRLQTYNETFTGATLIFSKVLHYVYSGYMITWTAGKKVSNIINVYLISLIRNISEYQSNSGILSISYFSRSFMPKTLVLLLKIKHLRYVYVQYYLN